MKIAVISMIRDNWGGSEELWYEMAKKAIEQGHQIIHLAFETPDKHQKIKELESLGMLHYTRPGWIPVNASNKKFIYLGWNFLRKQIHDPFKKIFNHQPDIVLYNGTCYSISNENRLLRQIAKKRSKPLKFFIIGHLNHEFSGCLNPSEASRIKLAYQLCKKVFFVSQRSIEIAQRHLCDDIVNAAIIRNPVNLSSVELMDFPSINQSVQLAVVGNLTTAHKGQDILFHALSRWKETDWQLNIYGTGTDLNYLKELALYLKLQSKIIFHGKVNDIREIWKRNHLLLMPSIMEGMPLAVVEAMLCGRICIVTNVGGHAEWIVHGQNGFLAAAPSTDAIVEALSKAWLKKDTWAEIARNAHVTAYKLYDPDAGTTLLNRIIAE